MADTQVSFQAEVAAEFINRRVPGTRVIPHNCMIQDYDESFYKQFHIVVCGLVGIVRKYFWSLSCEV
jgi:ubiquitin-activating enzyme E1 C